jgi:hypothetical protein
MYNYVIADETVKDKRLIQILDGLATIEDCQFTNINETVRICAIIGVFKRR